MLRVPFLTPRRSAPIRRLLCLGKGTVHLFTAEVASQPLGVGRGPRPASGVGRDDILSEQEVEEAAEGGDEPAGASAGHR